jgi:hypothetical protein
VTDDFYCDEALSGRTPVTVVMETDAAEISGRLPVGTLLVPCFCMPSRIRWYSMSRDLKPVDHEPVDLAEALSLVDRYFGQLRSTCASGEDALAATMFGFARAKGDFLELCLNGVSEISVRVAST